jgi:uncharacterized protein YcbK (DUF882 family)
MRGDLLSAALFGLMGALATTVVVSTTAADPPVPHGQHFALRKDRQTEDEAAGEVDTYATLFNVHTGEAVALSDAEPTEARFSTVLADRVTGQREDLDPRLLALLRGVARRNPGARLELLSGYRSPKLNEMLRKKGHNVASHSQHSLGHACDFRIVGLTPAEMKKEVEEVGWDGGIGRYDKESDLFVHADVGPKRVWFEGR